MTRFAFALSLALLVPAPLIAQPNEARQRYERGMQLFEEGRYDAALAELHRAHELAPHPRVSFAMARIHAMRGEPVEAVRHYRDALAGAQQLPAAERDAARGQLLEQEQRIVRLWIESPAEGAVVNVDGADIGTLPRSEPILVAGGEHVVTVRAPGHEQELRRVLVAGGTEHHLRFDLVPQRTAALRIVSNLLRVEVRIDGRPAGTTPMEGTIMVTPGRHVIVGRRAGYLESATEVEVQMGAEREVRLALARDPESVQTQGRLSLRLPDAPASFWIDGERIAERTSGVPIGLPTVRIEVTDRLPFEGVVEVSPGGETQFAPTLAWTPQARATRLAAADSQRTAGWGVAIAGGALLLAGIPVTIWNELRAPAAEEELVQLRECQMSAVGMDVEFVCGPGFVDRVTANQRLRTEIYATSFASYAMLGIGVLAAGVGIVLALTAPDEAGVDRAASAFNLRVGPGALTLEGTF